MVDMLLAARDAVGFLADLDEIGFSHSRLHQNAVIRSLEVIGEAAGKVSEETRSALSDLPWREMSAMRNRLIHGYADVRVDLVWSVAKSKLPPLISALAALFE